MIFHGTWASFSKGGGGGGGGCGPCVPPLDPCMWFESQLSLLQRNKLLCKLMIKGQTDDI